MYTYVHCLLANTAPRAHLQHSWKPPNHYAVSVAASAVALELLATHPKGGTKGE